MSGQFLYRATGPVTLYLGDAAKVLATLPDAIVDCVVTSPPYWGHRDYATGAWHGGRRRCQHHPAGARDGAVCPGCAAVYTDPQYGLEPTLDEYIGHLLGVFIQLRRVLKPAGTVWLNLADTYSSAAGGAPHGGRPQPGGGRLRPPRSQHVAAPKNLLGIPWRVAFALQADRWWLRQAVIWHKPNATPESVCDRPSCNYEYVFLLTRSARYHFDLDPIRVPLAHPDAADGTRVFGGVNRAHLGAAGASARRRGNVYDRPEYVTHPATSMGRRGRGQPVTTGTAHTTAHPPGRNPGSVWSITTRPNRLAHFAAFPVDARHRRRLPTGRSGLRPVLRNRHHRPGRPPSRHEVHRSRRKWSLPRPCSRPLVAVPARRRAPVTASSTHHDRASTRDVRVVPAGGEAGRG
jgi:site-specific DNA-methyltransferase (cytosine-N4-specific)